MKHRELGLGILLVAIASAAVRAPCASKKLGRQLDDVEVTAIGP